MFQQEVSSHKLLMSSKSFMLAAALLPEDLPSFGVSFIVSHFLSHKVQGGSVCGGGGGEPHFKKDVGSCMAHKTFL